jgi:hypothetical protein
MTRRERGVTEGWGQEAKGEEEGVREWKQAGGRGE